MVHVDLSLQLWRLHICSWMSGLCDAQLHVMQLHEEGCLFV